MTAPFELVLTASGAHALRDRATGEVMHPNGPALEARELFVRPSRLEQRLADGPLTLLDVGLGAGANALAALRAEGPLTVWSIDRTLEPLRFALANASAFGWDAADRQAVEALLAGSAERWSYFEGDLLAELARLPAQSADIVFWDPYSVRSQPALWTVQAFSALRRVCKPGATVHTYSGATSVRAALLLAGFAVGLVPSVGKQKHSTIAALCPSAIARPLQRSWLGGVTNPSALPEDAPPDALERLRALPQLR